MSGGLRSREGTTSSFPDQVAQFLLSHVMVLFTVSAFFLVTSRTRDDPLGESVKTHSVASIWMEVLEETEKKMVKFVSFLSPRPSSPREEGR